MAIYIGCQTHTWEILDAIAGNRDCLRALGY